MDALERVCTERGAGVAFDCCGHPLDGYGDARAAQRTVARIQRHLDDLGVRRLATVCPNCLAYLGDRIEQPVVSAVELLKEWGIGKVTVPAGVLFTPCPDRKTHVGEALVRSACEMGAVRTLDRVGCCGLRPEIVLRGPHVAKACTDRALAAAGEETLYTYCASCAGQFARAGYRDCRHLVSLMLGVDETPDAAHALANRARRRFDRAIEPQGAR
jgi:Fe-S oxidoreductase